MSTRPKVVALALLLLLSGGVAAVLAGAWLRGNVTCAQLPSMAEAEAIVAREELVSQIEAVNPGFVFVNVLPGEDCPGRATLTIAYATKRDRQAIQAILSESASHRSGGLLAPAHLFGIPYRLQNT
jgi:predicted exporter